MEETEEKYFMWYERNHSYADRTHVTYGPHYHSDVERAPYHSLTDILRTHLTATVQKRLKGAKMGTIIKAHRAHSAGDMMLLRINKEQKRSLDELIKVHKEMDELSKKEKELQEKIDIISSRVLPKEERW
jgi:hypothetical protein